MASMADGPEPYLREADSIGPEDWDVHDLIDALLAGLAGPLRTIRGRTAGSEQGRLSTSLEAMAEVVEAAARRYRTATQSLEVVLQLERFANVTRRLAERLREQGA
jgi:hypothetical protein